MGKLLQISIFQNRKNFTLIIQKSGDIAIQSEENIFFKSDGLTSETPPGYSFPYDFFPGKLFCVKRPQLSETAKFRTKTPRS